MQKLLLAFLFVLLTRQLYSQDLITKELKWIHHDSTETISFQNKDQILKWSYDQLPFPSVHSKDIQVNESNIYIIMVTGCSGLPCWRIFIFKKVDVLWQLILSTDARLIEKIEIMVDNIQEKIKFKTESGQIGELLFKELI